MSHAEANHDPTEAARPWNPDRRVQERPHALAPDRDLIEAIVCLANAEGGELWLGVEDDGAPTGLHIEHQQLMGTGRVS